MNNLSLATNVVHRVLSMPRNRVGVKAVIKQ